MPSLTFAYDDNLGIPPGLPEAMRDAVTASSGEPSEIKLASFHELDAMLGAFSRGEAQIMFCPAGCFPFISTRLAIVGQATVGDTGDTTLTSVLVARNDTGASDVASAAGLRFGAINGFCTTSYWAPQFLARASGADPAALDLTWVGGFDDLVASLGDGRADVAMVWEPFLAKHPEAAATLHELGRSADLPAPLLVTDADISPSVLTALRGMVPYHGGPGGTGLFGGIAAPDRATIESFFDRILAVRPDLSIAPTLW